jgi:hypothetical protein
MVIRQKLKASIAWEERAKQRQPAALGAGETRGTKWKIFQALQLFHEIVIASRKKTSFLLMSFLNQDYLF